MSLNKDSGIKKIRANSGNKNCIKTYKKYIFINFELLGLLEIKVKNAEDDEKSNNCRSATKIPIKKIYLP